MKEEITMLQIGKMNTLTVVESYEHLPASGGAAAELALQTNPRLTALMCTADVLALSAMDYLRAHGIYVPGQMTVTGFDGIPEALGRGLTTVAQPSLEKGKRAGRLLGHLPRDGRPVILRLPELNFFDDKEGKPLAIQQHIGRRPIASKAPWIPPRTRFLRRTFARGCATPSRLRRA